jgi:RNA polymerase sigma factor (TIGR02999 family)
MGRLFMAPETPLSSEITGLLHRWKEGDVEALSQAASLAYDELRAIAGGFLRREAPGHTLQATGLVNELYLRLARQKSVQFESRRHFYAFAAFLMRRILIDHARQAATAKRQGVRVPLHEEMAWVNAAGEDVIALDHAIEELGALDDRKARVVELRCFLGCTIEETAEVLGVGHSTVEREFQFAKTWLFARLYPE